MRTAGAARIAAVALATSQLGATCAYSPPPVLSHGQGADTLGPARGSVAAEAGWAKSASWWNSRNAADFDLQGGAFGVARIRVGISDDVDVGLVGGVGPERTFVLAPETKWRFARLSMPGEKGSPGFHAALISGFGVGRADYRYEVVPCPGSPSCGLRMVQAGEPPPRYTFLAPYTGVVVSGGVEVVQMLLGLRLAASETLGNGIVDLTWFPVLAYGVQIHPDRLLGLYAEGGVAGGLTTNDWGDSALLGYVTAGVSLTFDDLWKRSVVTTPAR
jgi:hypothetical protein